MLYLAHTTEILETAEQHFRTVLGSSPGFGRLYGSRQPSPSDQIVFATFQSMDVQKARFGRRAFERVIVDEGHHSQADSFLRTVQYFDAAFTVATTATPNRMDGRDIRDIFGNAVYRFPLDEAIAEDRYLARVHYRMLFDHEVDPTRIESGQTVAISDVERAFFIDTNERSFREGGRNGEMIRAIEREITARSIQNPRVLIFGPDIPFAERFAEDMRASRWTAAALHSNTDELSHRDRRFLADTFQSGGISAITTVDLFNEGVDVPDANVIVFCRSTKSERVFLQQLGRGLRRIEGQKDDVLIIDFAASVERYEFVSRLAERVVSHEKTDRQEGNRPARQGSFEFIAFDRDILEILNAALPGDAAVAFERNFAAARTFMAREGHLLVPRDHIEQVDGKPVSLGIAVGNWRQRHQRGDLSDDRVQRLEAIGMAWNHRDKVVRDVLEAAKAFRGREGHLNVHVRHMEPTANGYVELGRILKRWRSSRNRGLLAENLATELDALGMVWNPFNLAFDENFTAARQFSEREGHLDVPYRHVETVGSRVINLGARVANWRNERRSGTLDQSRVERLDGLGMIWDSPQPTFDRNFAAARQFYEREQHLRVPSGHEEDGFEGVNLASVVMRWRKAIRAGELSADSVARLEAIGVIPDHYLDSTFEENFGLAKHFFEEHGHLRVPFRHRPVGADKNLDDIVRKWRTSRRDGKLDPERVARLNGIGMSWDDALTQNFEQNRRAATQFFEREGHLRVPTRHFEDLGDRMVGLGNVVSGWRRQYRNGKMPPERVQILEAIGMAWDVRGSTISGNRGSESADYGTRGLP